MADTVQPWNAATLPGIAAAPVKKRLQIFMRRRSTTALLMCMPLILIVAGLIVYPAFYSIYLSMLNKAQTRFIGLANFTFLLSRDTFWMVVQQSAIFALSAVFFKALIGLVTAHLVNNLPVKGQRKWRGMLLVPWVIPLALSTLGWWWLFDPTNSAFNYTLNSLGFGRIAWLSSPYWARFSVILVNVWFGAPFFLIMYLAALKSVPEQLYEGGRHRWRYCLAEIQAHHAADDAQHHRHHRAVLADRYLRQLRHRADHDRGRPAQHDACVCDLFVPARHPLRRPAARSGDLAVHVPDPGRRRNLHPARRTKAGEGNRMSAAALATPASRAVRVGSSLRRNRRWALILSYVFLVMFAIFFLMPPYYMVVTALKSDAEMARLATNPWFIFDGVTLDQFKILLTQTDFLIFFKNTVIVTVCVVAITMVVSVLAAFSLGRMKFWGSSILATGIFLTYLVPDTLLFIPMFQIVKSIGLLNSYWGMVLVYPTLTVPFCTWIMIGYFQSIPKELDEAALIDGAGHMQMLTKIFIPVALPGIIAAMIFAFTVSWAAFVYPMAFLYSSDQQVLTVGTVTSLIRGDVYKWGMLMAGALLAAAPPLVIYAFLMDYYIAGLTAGATKG